MKIVLFRFAIVWIVLHILLFFIEWWRYKHNGLNLKYFCKNGMMDITRAILIIDITVGVILLFGFLMKWILQPII